MDSRSDFFRTSDDYLPPFFAEPQFGDGYEYLTGLEDQAILAVPLSYCLPPATKNATELHDSPVVNELLKKTVKVSDSPMADEVFKERVVPSDPLDEPKEPEILMIEAGPASTRTRKRRARPVPDWLAKNFDIVAIPRKNAITIDKYYYDKKTRVKCRSIVEAWNYYTTGERPTSAKKRKRESETELKPLTKSLREIYANIWKLLVKLKDDNKKPAAVDDKGKDILEYDKGKGILEYDSEATLDDDDIGGTSANGEPDQSIDSPVPVSDPIEDGNLVEIPINYCLDIDLISPF